MASEGSTEPQRRVAVWREQQLRGHVRLCAPFRRIVEAFGSRCSACSPGPSLGKSCRVSSTVGVGGRPQLQAGCGTAQWVGLGTNGGHEEYLSCAMMKIASTTLRYAELAGVQQVNGNLVAEPIECFEERIKGFGATAIGDAGDVFDHHQSWMQFGDETNVDFLHRGHGWSSSGCTSCLRSRSRPCGVHVLGVTGIRWGRGWPSKPATS